MDKDLELTWEFVAKVVVEAYERGMEVGLEVGAPNPYSVGSSAYFAFVQGQEMARRPKYLRIQAYLDKVFKEWATRKVLPVAIECRQGRSPASWYLALRGGSQAEQDTITLVAKAYSDGIAPSNRNV